MKTIFGLLFAFTIYGTTNSLQLGWSSANSVSRVKRFDKSDVDRYNNQRKRFEAESNIGAVPNLTWDPALEKIAKEFPFDCSQWKHGTDYRILPLQGDIGTEDAVQVYQLLEWLVPGHQDFQNITSGQRALLKKMDDYMNANSDRWIMYGYEYLNEQQTKIGCSDTACEGNSQPEVVTGLGFPPINKMRGVCVFGPTSEINPQIRKEAYTYGKSISPGGAVRDGTINKAVKIAETLALYLPDGAQAHLNNVPIQPSQTSPPTQSAYAQPPPAQSAPVQSVPEQSAPVPDVHGVPEKQQATTPSSPASTSATELFPVVVMVVGFVL